MKSFNHHNVVSSLQPKINLKQYLHLLQIQPNLHKFMLEQNHIRRGIAPYKTASLSNSNVALLVPVMFSE